MTADVMTVKGEHHQGGNSGKLGPGDIGMRKACISGSLGEVWTTARLGLTTALLENDKSMCRRKENGDFPVGSRYRCQAEVIFPPILLTPSAHSMEFQTAQ